MAKSISLYKENSSSFLFCKHVIHACSRFFFPFYRDLRCLRNTIHINLFLTYILSIFLWILTLTLQVGIKNEGDGEKENAFLLWQEDFFPPLDNLKKNRWERQISTWFNDAWKQSFKVWQNVTLLKGNVKSIFNCNFFQSMGLVWLNQISVN